VIFVQFRLAQLFGKKTRKPPVNFGTFFIKGFDFLHFIPAPQGFSD
jgi:hypothetical protein